MMVARHTIFITSPLEAEHVDVIRAVDPARVDVLYEPDLLPPTRYVADHKGGPHQRSADEEKRWRTCLAGAEILWDFPPLEPDGRSPMRDAPGVRWVQTTSTGVGPLVKMHGLQGADIVVTTARGVHAGPLAEFVMLGLLAHFRGLRYLEDEQRAHRWRRYCGEEMAGKNVVIVGAGDLARGTAVLARAFRMRVEAITRNPERSRAHRDVFDAIHPVERLHDRLAVADALVVTVPHTPQTDRMIDRDAFAALKPGGAFVNIARGQVVDESALIEKLRSGHVGFAALDVAATEPLPPESPLWDMPNVLISPHSASTVAAENERIVDIFCQNLRLYLAGERDKMKNILDKNLLY
jgi:phosphoglycerate dehydrogenase-like enzyme